MIGIQRISICCGLVLALSAAESPPQRTAGKYQVSLRTPPDGVYAQEETEIEFRVEDTSRIDPLTGATPVVRARIEVSIDMPAMPGMPSFQELAHTESVPGDYGVHPTFAHGGDYVMRISITPPEDRAFRVDFPIQVQDADAGRNRKPRPPRFSLEVMSSPKSLKPGETVSLRLAVRDRDQPREAVHQFDRAHEELMHLVIVRDDLEHFAHEHPVLNADGVFELSYRFSAPGEYHLFADVAPKGAGSQVLMSKIRVSGKALRSSLELRAPMQEVDGLRIQSQTGWAPLKKTSPVCFDVEPATGLQPYLGAKAHLIAIHQDGLTFVHAHPDDTASPGSTFVFQARFPRPGLYRVWIQFKRNDRVVTGDFTIEAKDQ